MRPTAGRRSWPPTGAWPASFRGLAASNAALRTSACERRIARLEWRVTCAERLAACCESRARWVCFGRKPLWASCRPKNFVRRAFGAGRKTQSRDRSELEVWRARLSERRVSRAGLRATQNRRDAAWDGRRAAVNGPQPRSVTRGMGW